MPGSGFLSHFRATWKLGLQLAMVPGNILQLAMVPGNILQLAMVPGNVLQLVIPSLDVAAAVKTKGVGDGSSSWSSSTAPAAGAEVGSQERPRAYNYPALQEQVHHQIAQIAPPYETHTLGDHYPTKLLAASSYQASEAVIISSTAAGLDARRQQHQEQLLREDPDADKSTKTKTTLLCTTSSTTLVSAPFQRPAMASSSTTTPSSQHTRLSSPPEEQAAAAARRLVLGAGSYNSSAEHDVGNKLRHFISSCGSCCRDGLDCLEGCGGWWRIPLYGCPKGSLKLEDGTEATLRNRLARVAEEPMYPWHLPYVDTEGKKRV